MLPGAGHAHARPAGPRHAHLPDRQGRRAALGCADGRRRRRARRRAREIRDQLIAQQVAATGTSSFALIDERASRTPRRPTTPARTTPTWRARSAQRRRRPRVGGDQRQARQGRRRHRGRTRARRARARRLDARSRASARRRRRCGGRRLADRRRTRRSPTRSGRSLKDEIHHPPDCDSDLYNARPRSCKKHGGQTHENRMLGDDAEPDVGHARPRQHYRCGNSGAIDLNSAGAGRRGAASSTRSGRASRARLPHALARRRPLRPHAHRRRRPSGAPAPERRRSARATGPLDDCAAGPADRLGRARHHRLRRRLRRRRGGIPFGPPDPQIASADLPGARPHARVHRRYGLRRGRRRSSSPG